MVYLEGLCYTCPVTAHCVACIGKCSIYACHSVVCIVLFALATAVYIGLYFIHREALAVCRSTLYYKHMHVLHKLLVLTVDYGFSLHVSTEALCLFGRV